MALKQFLEKCAPHVTTLRRSAMFALSRGAKELFHTNFLAFVLELDEEAVDFADWKTVLEVRRALLERIFGADAPQRVMAWREAQSLDLVLAAAPGATEDGHPQLAKTVLDGPRRKPSEPPGGTEHLPRCLIVIEAKVKALPDVQQLHRYNQLLHSGLALTLDPEVVLKNGEEAAVWGRLDVHTTDDHCGSTALLKAFPPELCYDADTIGTKQRRCISTGYGKVRRVLLAPEDPSKAASEAGWDFISFSDLLVDFDAATGENCGALSAMLRDYATSTRALLTVLNEVGDLVSEKYVKAATYMTLGNVNAAANYFRSLRIHDVLGKRGYSVLQRALDDSLDSQSVLKEVGDWKRAAEVFMTRGTPGVCIEFRLTDGCGRELRQVSLGIQIQGTSFRRYLSASHPSETKAEHSLRNLAGRLPQGSISAEGCWWALGSATANMPTKKFNEHAFLYVDLDATSWTFEDLKFELILSMQLAAKLVLDNAFCEGARALMRSRRFSG
jgi:hypothetical protein